MIQIKYEEKYQTGMIFRSKRYPWADIVINAVSYNRIVDNADDFNKFSTVGWKRVNTIEFDKYICKMKGYNYAPDESGRMDFNGKTTYPYVYSGEMMPKSMDSYIKKYELEFAETDNKEVKVYKADNIGYLSRFVK